MSGLATPAGNALLAGRGPHTMSEITPNGYARRDDWRWLAGRRRPDVRGDTEDGDTAGGSEDETMRELAGVAPLAAA